LCQCLSEVFLVICVFRTYFEHAIVCFNFVQQLTVLNQFAVLTFDYFIINVALRVGVVNKHMYAVHVVMHQDDSKVIRKSNTAH